MNGLMNIICLFDTLSAKKNSIPQTVKTGACTHKAKRQMYRA